MKIAVIGSGISGNAAAWALSRDHEVTLYEKRERAGGHSATVDVDYDGTTIPVDTGFIVYNTDNYTLLTRMFDYLKVSTQETSMSFAVSLDDGSFEWCGSGLRQIFAQRRNLFSPGFLLMLNDIFRFNTLAKRDLDAGVLCGMSLGDYITQRGFSERLRDDYIVPMTAAIWSTPAAQMLDFPAESLVRFLDNHRLIHNKRPLWRTVTGGSRTYVSRLLADFQGEVLLGTGVEKILRHEDNVWISDTRGQTTRFDGVVMATHSDQALLAIGDADADERAVLGAVAYRPNRVWLHRDPSLMPRRRGAWAAWNYIGNRGRRDNRDITVTYWMNRLQNIDERYPLFITLNPRHEPHPDLTFATFDYSHPQFDADALAAQEQLPAIQGHRNTWYCGAWTRHGFHEDGLASGLHVASLLGSAAPWDRPARNFLPVEPIGAATLEAAE